MAADIGQTPSDACESDVRSAQWERWNHCCHSPFTALQNDSRHNLVRYHAHHSILSAATEYASGITQATHTEQGCGRTRTNVGDTHASLHVKYLYSSSISTGSALGGICTRTDERVTVENRRKRLVRGWAISISMDSVSTTRRSEKFPRVVPIKLLSRAMAQTAMGDGYCSPANFHLISDEEFVSEVRGVDERCPVHLVWVDSGFLDGILLRQGCQ